MRDITMTGSDRPPPPPLDPPAPPAPPAAGADAGSGGPAVRWERLVTTVSLAVIALVPSLLVFRDRWLGDAGVRELLREAWGTEPDHGRDLRAYAPPEFARQISGKLEQCLRGERIEDLLEISGPQGGRRTFSIVYHPVRDERGDVTQLSMNILETTEHTAAERALRASEERIAGIIASTMDAIITLDERQRIVVFNAAATMVPVVPAQNTCEALRVSASAATAVSHASSWLTSRPATPTDPTSSSNPRSAAAGSCPTNSSTSSSNFGC